MKVSCESEVVIRLSEWEVEELFEALLRSRESLERGKGNPSDINILDDLIEHMDGILP